MTIYVAVGYTLYQKHRFYRILSSAANHSLRHGISYIQHSTCSCQSLITTGFTIDTQKKNFNWQVGTGFKPVPTIVVSKIII
jgi:hypothetical protein